MSLSPHLHTPPSPSLISLMFSVDVSILAPCLLTISLFSQFRPDSSLFSRPSLFPVSVVIKQLSHLVATIVIFRTDTA